MFPIEEHPDMPEHELWFKDERSGSIVAKLQLINTGRGKDIMINKKDLINILATYNGEKDRGIVHTIEWIQEMKKLQEQFNNGELT